MPEEILDTRKEKVKDVKEEKEDGLVQQYWKKVQEHRFFVVAKKMVNKIKAAKAKSDSKKKKSKESKNKSSTDEAK